MVLTTLFVRHRKTYEGTDRGPFGFGLIGLGLMLLCLSSFTACGPEGDSGNGGVIAAPGNGKGYGYGRQPKDSGGSTTDPSTGGTTTGTSTDPGGSPGTTTSGTPTVSVSLAWDAVPNQSVTGYFVYYGTHSPNSSGSCAYAQSTFTTSTVATVDGLPPNTSYFFAVSAYNGLQSLCSAEVSTITQPA